MQQISIALPENLENIKLPSPEMLNFWRLAEERVFFIDFEIDDSLIEITKEIMLINFRDKGIPVEERKPIILPVFTCGGDLSSAYTLISVCEASTTPIWTINMGIAYSAGLLILLSGSKRFGLKRSQAMAHSGSASLGGTYEQVQENTKSYEKMIQEMRQYILDRTKIDIKTFNKNKSKDWYFSDDQQIEYGIIDKLITSLDEVM